MAIEELDAAALAFGLFVCAYGVFSYLVKERLYLGEAPLAFVLGIALGPYGIGQLTRWDGQGEDAGRADAISLGLSRVVIGVQVALVGIQLPQYYVVHERRTLAMLLLPTMGIMWLITGTCIKTMIPGIPWVVALVVAACTTPTDPVLSNAIVKGAFADQFVPARLRNVISAESGANDGLGYVFVFLALRFLTKDSPSEALKTLLLQDILYTVCGAVVLGIVVGLGANRALRFGCRHNYIDKESFLLFGPMLGIFSIGLGGAIGVDDVLVSFVAGHAFSYDGWYRRETEEDEVQNVLDFLLNSLFFSFAGAAVPFGMFNMPELGVTPLRLLGLAVLVLLFRRLPPLLLLYRFMPAVEDVSEAAFVGYFGPMGAGAILYCASVLNDLPSDVVEGSPQWKARQIIRPVIYTLVLASLFGHTLVIPLVKVFFDVRGWRGVQLKTTRQREESSGSEQEDAEEDYEEGVGPAPEQQRQRRDTGERDQDGSTSSGQDEMRQPISSVHPTLSSMGRRGTGGSIRFSRSDIDAAYCAGGSDATGNSSWRMSTGHKLGPHLPAEHRESRHADHRLEEGR
ncbi:unnamed protein product [Parajaminaea phylloscopi]